MIPGKLAEKLNLNRQSWSNLLNNFDWNEAREGVNRESRARILLLGLPGAGKSTLLNQLCGWTVSQPQAGSPGLDRVGLESPGMTEDFGLFGLVDLAEEMDTHPYLDLSGGSYYYPESWLSGQGYQAENGRLPGVEPGLNGLLSLDGLDPLAMAEGADLLVYVLDGTAGVRPADYRWVGRLRRLGAPLLVALNKSDLLAGELPARQVEFETRLATGVLPVSALTGANVEAGLLPRMVNLCPNLTVALGRELRGFRRRAAARLVHRAALLNGLVALEPVPLIDLPVQIMTLTGLMLRIGAVYERPPTDIRRREVVAAVAGGLVGRLAAQQLVKIVPVVGWAISSVIGWSCTWALGRAAIAYFEAGGDAAVDRSWHWTKGGVGRVYRLVGQRWRQRPRLKLEWDREMKDE